MQPPLLLAYVVGAIAMPIDIVGVNVKCGDGPYSMTCESGHKHTLDIGPREPAPEPKVIAFAALSEDASASKPSEVNEDIPCQDGPWAMQCTYPDVRTFGIYTRELEA